MNPDELPVEVSDKKYNGMSIDELCLSLILNDNLLFGLFFLSGDLSMEPSDDQKLMFLDDSQQVLMCTSRNVGKTTGLRMRILRTMCTYLPPDPNGTSAEEILVFTPAQSHLKLLVNRLFLDISGELAFRSLVVTQRAGDDAYILTTTRLEIHFRIEGQSGTDINMAGIHPFLIIGDEMAWGNDFCHSSRMAGATQRTRWVYAGVPNSIRGLFYRLDMTDEGSDWSRHKCSMLTANPVVDSSGAYRKKLAKMYGGEHSPDFVTQVLGQWGDEAMSSFPPGTVSWDKSIPYFIKTFRGAEVKEMLASNVSLSASIGIPAVRCYRAVLGVDYGNSPDPATILCAIQHDKNGPWYTYFRISLFAVPSTHIIDVMKYLVQNTLGNKVVSISTDSIPFFHEMTVNPSNAYIFQHITKLTVAGGVVEIDRVLDLIIDDSNRRRWDVEQHRKENNVIKERRKYWLTEMFRRYMFNRINQADGIQLVMGYDPELESELMQTIERRGENGYVTYTVPRQSVNRPVGQRAYTPDQITDAARAMADCIMTIGETEKVDSGEVSAQELIAAMGMTQSRLTPGSPFSRRTPTVGVH